MKNVLEREMELLVLDFVGSGESDGQYVTLGVEEAKNINVVVDYISKNKNVNDIFLWGRSMGAVAGTSFPTQLSFTSARTLTRYRELYSTVPSAASRSSSSN